VIYVIYEDRETGEVLGTKHHTTTVPGSRDTLIDLGDGRGERRVSWSRWQYDERKWPESLQGMDRVHCEAVVTIDLI